MEVTIKRATSVDLDDILSLFENTIEHCCQDDYNTEQIKAWQSSKNKKDKWLNRINSEHFYIAQQNGQIIGFASLAPIDHIDMMYVHKDFQKLGIASKLLSHLTTIAKYNHVKTLSSFASKTALPFFMAKGFEIISPKENYIDNTLIINYIINKELP